jgi:hypothetical protein
MALLLLGLERIALGFAETGALIRKRLSDRRILLIAPRMVWPSAYAPKPASVGRPAGKPAAGDGD